MAQLRENVVGTLRKHGVRRGPCRCSTRTYSFEYTWNAIWSILWLACRYKKEACVKTQCVLTLTDKKINAQMYLPTPTTGRRRSRANSTVSASSGRTVRRRLSYSSGSRSIGSSGSSTKTNYTTPQHDAKRQYKFKRSSKKRRVRWAKFVKKVQAATISEQGHTTIVRNSSLPVLFTSPTRQGWLSCMMYGERGTGTSYEIGNFDIYEIIAADNRLDFQTAKKVKFLNCVLDVTIANVGVPAAEIDCYEVRYYGSTQQSVQQCLQRDENQVPETVANVSPALNEPMDIGDRGVTLFDLPEFIRSAKCKIFKKTKFFLKGGDAITMQMRDPKQHIYNTAEQAPYTTNQNKFATKFTKGYFFVVKTVVGGDTSPAVTIAATRSYKYTILQDNRLFSTVRLGN